MTYPSGLDTFDRKNPTDPLSDGHAELHNDISTAVEAIETELGTNPSGAEATVAARLTAGESATSGAQSTADAAIPKATLDAQTVLAAVTDNTPVALSVTEQTLVGRKTGGDVAALSASEAKTLLAIANTDVSGLGTASTKNVAVSGDAASGEVVKGSDSRLSDARTPTSHASSHASAGSDPLTLSASQITGTAVVTNDSRLSDARTPTAHAASHGTGQSDAITIAPAQVTGTALVASTADAKGDLLAATAAGAVTNLAVGADGAHLRAASSASAGVAWVRQSPPINVGDFFTPGIYTNTTNFTSTQGQCWYWPIFIPQAMTVSEVRLIMGGSAAASGALWRLGFFNADTPGTGPGTVLADLSTVNPTTSGTKAWTGLSVAISAGILWCGMALQGTGSGGGNYYYTSNPGVSGVVKSGSIGTNVYNHILTQSSVSGAFATAAPTASGSSVGPLLEFKRSA